MNTIINTDFSFPGLKSRYVGKVRDVYSVDDLVVMVATDRISAFDCVLPEGIPYKDQILNKIAANFLDATADILPNWKLAVPDPAVTVGYRCELYEHIAGETFVKDDRPASEMESNIRKCLESL